MVVVVSNPILVACRRAGGLDTSDEALVDQESQGVVYRLARDGPDFGPHHIGDVVCRAVRSTRHRPQDSEALGRDLHAVPA
jgi:hypothetical protein